jgi:hypothetical protein
MDGLRKLKLSAWLDCYSFYLDPLGYFVLAKTRSDRQRLIEQSSFSVRRLAAIIFSFVSGIASRKVCIGVLP